ncbi:MAG: response regulator transcription factor [Gammaproteobacteria bacterium]|nr:response regulator transcription factor [Gammaproteobacteria bacterium]
MKKHILIVEDDPHIRMGVADTFRSEGFEVSELGNGKQVLEKVQQLQPDLILLDVMLPGKSGYDACRDMREHQIRTPIIMLTAKGQEIDKVVGLELGADDYVTKPFGVRELLARVQAVLRRSQPEEPTEASMPANIDFGEVSIDTAALRGTRAAEPFELKPRELKVLNVLFQNRGNAVSRDELLNQVWGVDYYGTTRTLDQVIVKIRQKIEADHAKPEFLTTVHGLGYRLEKENHQ